MYEDDERCLCGAKVGLRYCTGYTSLSIDKVNIKTTDHSILQFGAPISVMWEDSYLATLETES